MVRSEHLEESPRSRRSVIDEDEEDLPKGNVKKRYDDDEQDAQVERPVRKEESPRKEQVQIREIFSDPSLQIINDKLNYLIDLVTKKL